MQFNADMIYQHYLTSFNHQTIHSLQLIRVTGGLDPIAAVRGGVQNGPVTFCYIKKIR